MSGYWTREDIKAARAAKTFRELLGVAMRIAARIPPPAMMVCGPISAGGVGSLSENLALLRKTIDVLASQGVNVFNQLPFESALRRICETLGLDEDSLLDEFYRPIFESSVLTEFYFVAGWKLPSVLLGSTNRPCA